MSDLFLVLIPCFIIPGLKMRAMKKFLIIASFGARIV